MDKEKVSEFNEKAKNKIKTFLIEAKVPLILITILLLIDLILGIITRFVAGGLAAGRPAPLEFVNGGDRFGESGSPAELIAAFGLDAAHIAAAAKKALARK